MKEIKINVPDNQAELFAEKLSALVKECGGNIGNEEKEVDLQDTSIPVWERVKTVFDAVELTGIELPENIEDLPIDIQAYIKLRVICAAYNGLTADTLNNFPKFTTDEYRYYPWFWLYTQKEIDNMDDEERTRVVGRSANSAYANAGVAYAGTGYGASYSNTHCGGRLCFFKEELATECGKRFFTLWAQYFGFIGKE